MDAVLEGLGSIFGHREAQIHEGLELVAFGKALLALKAILELALEQVDYDRAITLEVVLPGRLAV